MKTWHVEHAVIAAVLIAVWIATGREERELLGAVAVYLGHGCASIGARMEEREAIREKPSVTCFRHYWRYYVAKEIAWFAYFVWSGAWSALVGCVLFGLYPVWRRFYRRKVRPLAPEQATTAPPPPSFSFARAAARIRDLLGERGVSTHVGPYILTESVGVWATGDCVIVALPGHVARLRLDRNECERWVFWLLGISPGEKRRDFTMASLHAWSATGAPKVSN